MFRSMLAIVLLVSFQASARAQPVAPPAGDAHPKSVRAADAIPVERRLPADSITHHTLELPGGRTLAFTATAGAIRLTDDEGKPQAELAVIAYQLDGADRRVRPVTIAMNGGPGAASGWLQLGAMGPWRLPMSGDAHRPSAPPVLVDNAETWLDFTDLVFIDPAGTGYSRLADDTEPLRRRFWSVNGDIDTLADAIRRWLQANDRLQSPKFFAGESYGGFRGPRLARTLASDRGVGLSGLVLISPVLDFGLSSNAFDPFSLVAHLPSMAAAAHGLDAAQLTPAEDYATGEYLHDLLQGQRDPAVLDRISARVAALTGLDPALVRRRHGRIGAGLFLRERGAATGQVGSNYDATLTEADPFPENNFPEYPDPTFALLSAPVTAAMVDLINDRLHWHPDGAYELANNRIAREWDWGRGTGRPQAMDALRTALAIDPQFRVLIGHGLYDLVTPYLGTKLQVAQVPDYGSGHRLRLALHPGGHMFYTRDDQRAVLRDEARALVSGEDLD